MRYFLGFDVGASKTHALIADEQGRCLGFGQSGAGNWQVVGYDGLANALQEAFQEASFQAKVGVEQIAGAGFGVAGYDFPGDRGPHLEAIGRLGLSCPLEIVNDSLNGLLAGSSRGVGVCVTAGTSVNCRGRGADGREARIVGNGIPFGEFGGAAEIVWKGLHMVNYAWIKRIPPTALTGIYLEAVGATDELDLMDGLSNNRYHLFPFLAVQIFAAARAGDAAASQVIRWAGEELGWLVVSVVRQLGMEHDVVEVVLSGSIFEGGELILASLRDVVLEYVPQARLIQLEVPPVIGPVLLGMQAAGLDGYAIRSKLVESARPFVS